ncbi:MAG: 30S ribosomal protein S21 [Planctomycetota bacterium]
MIKVQVRPNEPLEAALRRFKRQCNYAGIFRLAKANTFHEKRSDKERRIRREQERQLYRLLRKSENKGPIKTRRKSKVKAKTTEGENTESTSSKDQAIPATEQKTTSEPKPQTGVDIAGVVSQTESTEAKPAEAPSLELPTNES